MNDDVAFFLAHVVPWPTDDRPGYVNIHSPWTRPGSSKPMMPGEAFTQLGAACHNVSGRSSDTYVCMSLQKDAGRPNNRRNRRAMRHASAALLLQAFWLDVDLKDGFTNLVDLLTKFGVWRRAVGLPEPSFVVFTGGGCHFHWVLPSPITVEIWQPLADALAEACKRHGFRADLKCTVDAARLMRVPGTFNHKTQPPKPVKLIHRGVLIPLAVIEAALAPFKSAKVYRPRVGPARLSLPAGAKPSQVFGPSDPGDKLDVGHTEWKPTMDEVADVCPWFADALATGGAAHREPQWREALRLAYFTKEGQETAHEVSGGHADYEVEPTDAKYAQVDPAFGWPQCRSIQQAGATQCATCPYLGDGKSPLNFVNPSVSATPSPASSSSGAGAGAPPQSPPPPPPVSGGNSASAPPPPPGPPGPPPRPFVPDGYRYNAAGYLEHVVKTKEGTSWEVMYPVRVSGFNRQTKNEEANYGHELVYWQFEDAKGFRPAQARMTQVHDLRRFKEALSEQGMSFKDNEAQHLGRFIVSFVQQLKNSVALSNVCEPYGWAFKDGLEDAFTFDRTRFNCNGNRTVAPTDVGLGKKFSAVGSLDIWKQACRLITEQKRPDLNALLASSFAAPLVQMTGHNGFVISAYSTASGVQKSGAMRVSQAVWGNPVDGMAGLDDTNNFLNVRLGMLRHLPLFVDELKFEDQFRKAEIMVLGLTQGKTKGKLTRDSATMETFTFNTLMVTAGNASLVQHISDAKTTTAGIARIFEFTVEKGNGLGIVDFGTAQTTIGKLERNYGTAGRVYAEFLGKNVERVRDDVIAMVSTVQNIVKASSDERFWVATIAILILGAKYANELGLTDIDVGQLSKFLLTQYYRQRRTSETSSANLSSASNVGRYVVDYVNARAGSTLKTDTVNVLPGRSPHPTTILNNINNLPRGVVNVHAVKNMQILRLSVADFGTWLVKERKVSRYEIINHVKELLPCVEKKGSLGRGTAYVGANERILEFDVSKFADIDLF